MVGIIAAQACRNREVVVVDPRILWLLLCIHRTVGSCGAVGVVIEIVVNLDVVGTQLLVVQHQVMKGDDLATVILLTVYGVGSNALVADGGLLHVSLLVIVAATCSQCTQQQDSINGISNHIKWFYSSSSSSSSSSAVMSFLAVTDCPSASVTDILSTSPSSTFLPAMSTCTWNPSMLSTPMYLLSVTG